MFAKKVIIAGCVKNCATALPQVLRNIRRIADLYAETSFIFVENDSQDSTKQILQAWRRNNPKTRLITLDGLDASCPIRTIRLEMVRNRYLAAVRSAYRDYHHLIVMDFDEVNARELDLEAVRRAIEFLESDPSHAGVFANQEGIYYDLWALRHPEQCPGDVWEEVFDCVVSHNLSDQEAFNKIFSRRIFSLPPTADAFEVNSAFGGLGIYRVRSVLKNQRSYVGHKEKWIQSTNGRRQFRWLTCEHVAFNAGFVERGERLFIAPYLLNWSTRDLQFNPLSHRYMLLEPESPKLQNNSRRPKIERNAPCPCGSGKKYKHCHGRTVN